MNRTIPNQARSNHERPEHQTAAHERAQPAARSEGTAATGTRDEVFSLSLVAFVSADFICAGPAPEAASSVRWLGETCTPDIARCDVRRRLPWER